MSGFFSGLAARLAGSVIARWWPYIVSGLLALAVAALWLRLDAVDAQRAAAEAETRQTAQRESILRDSLNTTLDTLASMAAAHARAIEAVADESAAAVARARRTSTLMEGARNAVSDPAAPVSAGVGAVIDGLRRSPAAAAGDAGGVPPTNSALPPPNLRPPPATP